MATTYWKDDPAHSEVQFKVKHLMITTVTGYLRKFDVEVETEEDDFAKASKILFTAVTESVDTNNVQRDTHLRSEDFFSAEKYPQIRFEGKKLVPAGDTYRLDGDLTIRNKTHPITLDVEYGGSVVDPYGQTKAGFTVTGHLKRKDFDLTWNAVTEAGQLVVSNDIRLHVELQLIKQAAKKTAETKEAKEAVV